MRRGGNVHGERHLRSRLRDEVTAPLSTITLTHPDPAIRHLDTLATTRPDQPLNCPHQNAGSSRRILIESTRGERGRALSLQVQHSLITSDRSPVIVARPLPVQSDQHAQTTMDINSRCRLHSAQEPVRSAWRNFEDAESAKRAVKSMAIPIESQKF
jgi:hypothetical protein